MAHPGPPLNPPLRVSVCSAQVCVPLGHSSLYLLGVVSLKRLFLPSFYRSPIPMMTGIFDCCVLLGFIFIWARPPWRPRHRRAQPIKAIRKQAQGSGPQGHICDRSSRQYTSRVNVCRAFQCPLSPKLIWLWISATSSNRTNCSFIKLIQRRFIRYKKYYSSIEIA